MFTLEEKINELFDSIDNEKIKDKEKLKELCSLVVNRRCHEKVISKIDRRLKQIKNEGIH